MQIGITSQVRVSTTMENILAFVGDFFRHGWQAGITIPIMRMSDFATYAITDSVQDEILHAIGEYKGKSVKIPNGIDAENGKLVFRNVDISELRAKLDAVKAIQVEYLAFDGRTRLCAARICKAFNINVNPDYRIVDGVDAVTEAIRLNCLRQVAMTRQDRLHAIGILHDEGKITRESDVARVLNSSSRTVHQTAYAGVQLVKVYKLDAGKIGQLGYPELKTVLDTPKADMAELVDKLVSGSNRDKILNRGFWEGIVKRLPNTTSSDFATYVLTGNDSKASLFMSRLADAEVAKAEVAKAEVAEVEVAEVEVAKAEVEVAKAEVEVAKAGKVRKHKAA